jgi:hypothetical protein
MLFPEDKTTIADRIVRRFIHGLSKQRGGMG